MYSYDNKPIFKKILKKLFKKDKQTYERVIKKINEIINSGNIKHYKNLKHSLKTIFYLNLFFHIIIYSKNTK